MNVSASVKASIRKSYHNSNLILHLGTAFKIWYENSWIQWCCNQLFYWSILECLWQLLQIRRTIFKTTSTSKSYQANLSPSTIHATFHKILGSMYYKFNFFISNQDKDHICKTIPPVFKQYFPKLTNIFYCFEIFIEWPKNQKARVQVYSNYKKTFNCEAPDFLESYRSSYLSFTLVWWPMEQIYK